MDETLIAGMALTVLLAALSFLDFLWRVNAMSAALDAIGVKVQTVLDTTTKVAAEVAALKASGEDPAKLQQIDAGLNQIISQLQALLPP